MARHYLMLFGAVFWLSTALLHAVIFYGTEDPQHNTSAPDGVLAGSGWQWEGVWGAFLGTPVGPRHFLTATHVGGAISNTFYYQGRGYPARAVTRAPDCDLALWRVGGVFPAYAPLHEATNEIGLEAMVVGRGTQRGLEIVATNVLEPMPRGWRWGVADGRQRWGRNRLSEVVDGGPGFGELLAARFDADGLPDECHLSTGDSGGAVFVNAGEGWSLAGISYAVDGPFSFTGTAGESGFFGALFDMGGLYGFDGTNWVWQPLEESAQPSAFYATRVAVHVDWIRGVLGAPLPEEERLVLQFANRPEGPFVDAAAFELDETARTIRLAPPEEPTFYRLRSCFAARIARVRTEPAAVVLEFE